MSSEVDAEEPGPVFWRARRTEPTTETRVVEMRAEPVQGPQTHVHVHVAPAQPAPGLQGRNVKMAPGWASLRTWFFALLWIATAILALLLWKPSWFHRIFGG